MKAVNNLVNAGVNGQRLYVCLDRTKKIVAQANSIFLVESKAFEQILSSALKESNVH